MWGYNCPAHDLDFVMNEYDGGKCVAIVEYKNENAPQEDYREWNYRGLLDLGERAGVPVFNVRYASDFSEWKVTPLNDQAKRWFSESRVLSEPEYIRILYRIRRRLVPKEVFAAIGKEISHDPKQDAA